MGDEGEEYGRRKRRRRKRVWEKKNINVHLTPGNLEANVDEAGHGKAGDTRAKPVAACDLDVGKAGDEGVEGREHSLEGGGAPPGLGHSAIECVDFVSVVPHI